MDDDETTWARVDRYFAEHLVDEDEALAAARESSSRTTMPRVEVSPTQGAFLSVIARASRARRALEFGTLAGYSTIWLARAVGPDGTVVSLEIEQQNADVAEENLQRAGVADRVDLRVGPAAESARNLMADEVEPFDLVFIDADKQNNPTYLQAALTLSRPGTVIVGDNVVRHGAVADPDSTDPRVHGTWRLVDLLGRDDRVQATALQTVGIKGWDGFAIGVVTEAR